MWAADFAERRTSVWTALLIGVWAAAIASAPSLTGRAVLVAPVVAIAALGGR